MQLPRSLGGVFGGEGWGAPENNGAGQHVYTRKGKLLLHIEKFNKEITELRISDPTGQ